MSKRSRSVSAMAVRAQKSAPSAASPASARDAEASRRARVLGVALVVIGALVWSTSLGGVFLYDDYDSITLNPHIRRLWPLSEAMSRPLAGAAETVSTRPLLSLTFALEYALHGLDLRAMHALNIAIHLACASLLFGFLARTLRGVQNPPRAIAGTAGLSDFRTVTTRLGATPEGFAFAVTLLWLVHPLHTSSVTYVVQR